MVNVIVDKSKSGASLGSGKFKSETTAPVVIVKPSEWARRDYNTPIIKQLIWKYEDEPSRRFCSIEETPIVRNRDVHLSEIHKQGKCGVDRVVKEGSRIEIKLVSSKPVQELLKGVSFDECMFND